MRAAKATPGPWKPRDPDVPQGANIIIDNISEQGFRGPICQMINYANAMSFTEGQQRCDQQMRKDADFIAHAPADIDTLLSALQDAKRENARLRGALEVASRFITGDQLEYAVINHPDKPQRALGEFLRDALLSEGQQ